MNSVKSNLDKMMERLNESLSRNTTADSFSIEASEKTSNKKRRLSVEDNDNVSCNSLNGSLTVSIPASPWIVRRMKADLIDTQTRNASLKQEVQRLHKKNQEIATEYEAKVRELEKQCEFTSQKALDMEKHMALLRKREHAAKQELIKVQRDKDSEKLKYEDAITHWQSTKIKADADSRQVQAMLNSELGECRTRSAKMSMEIQILSEELCNVRNQLDEAHVRLKEHDEITCQYEQQQQEIATANSRIQELENQIATYNDWKEIVNTTKTRLLNFPEMEREIERLKERNKRLEDLIGNKLLLEEQVNALQSRLDRKENSSNETVALQVKLQHVELELKEWIKVAQDYCLPNMVVCPMALRTRIQQLLENDIVVKCEQRSNANESKHMEAELNDFKQKNEILNKNLEELHTALKRHKNFKERVQRKLYLVSKERDFYKQMLDQHNERDLTINTTTQDTANLEQQQLKARVEMLEKTLTGYKEMCANLEKDLTQTRMGSASMDQALEIMDGTTYDHIKKELDSLRLENERLRTRKDTLELELEQLMLRGNIGADTGKVLHLIQNPSDVAYEENQTLIEKLQAEIERLKRRNKKLEEDETTQVRFNETNNMTMNIKEINQLRAELETNNAKMKRMKEAYKTVNLEFREVCYMLFGYKIDRVGANTNYKLSSMYAESPDDYLNFRLNESNTLDMLETPYLSTLKSFIESQLMVNKSIPAFLSALTLDLFQRSTVTQG